MKILLLLLWVSFFFIFFLFSQKSLGNDSVFQSIFLEANLYIFISFFFIYFIISWENKFKKWEENISSGSFLDSLNFSLKSLVQIFFRDIVYYVSIILFYLWFYILFWEFFWNITLSQIFFLFNLLVVFLFSLEHKISLFWDLLRVNTSIISLYYLVFHVIYIFWYPLYFSIFDIWNICCVFLLLYLFIYNSPWKSYRNIFYTYIITFLFLEINVFLKYFFWGNIYIYISNSFLFASLLSIFPEFLKNILKIPLRVSRILSLIFFALSISLSFSDFSFINNYSLLLILICWVSSIFLFSFHKIFTNYFAAFFGSAWIFFTLSQMYFFIIPEDIHKNYIFILYYILSVFFLFPYKISTKQNTLDTYFFHSVSFLVNLVCVFSFFIFVDFSILLVWLFLLMESVYFASSYYSLKK